MDVVVNFLMSLTYKALDSELVSWCRMADRKGNKNAPHLILKQVIQFLSEQIILPVAAAAAAIKLLSLSTFIRFFRLHSSFVDESP